MNSTKSILSLTLLFLCLAILNGCVSQWIRSGDPRYSHLLERDLHQMESIQLEDYSESKPVTLEEASDHRMDDVLQSEPPDRIGIGRNAIRQYLGVD